MLPRSSHSSGLAGELKEKLVLAGHRDTLSLFHNVPDGTGIICHSLFIEYFSFSQTYFIENIETWHCIKIFRFLKLFQVVVGLNSGSLPRQAQDCSLERWNQEGACRTLCFHTTAISTLARAAGVSQASWGALLGFPYGRGMWGESSESHLRFQPLHTSCAYIPLPAVCNYYTHLHVILGNGGLVHTRSSR